MPDTEGRDSCRRVACGLAFFLCGPVAAIEKDLAARTRRGASVTHELAKGLVVGQRMTCPVDADWTEEAMFNGIPF